MKYNRGTELNLKQYKNLNVVLGTIDKYNPRTLYIRISGWGNPIDYDDNIDYKSVIRKFNKKIRTILFNELGDIFNRSMSMVDLDMRESGINDNKSSFMSCEITLFQVNNYLIDSNEITEEINKIVNRVLDDVFKANDYFQFFKKKKSAKESLIESLIV